LIRTQTASYRALFLASSFSFPRVDKYFGGIGHGLEFSDALLNAMRIKIRDRIARQDDNLSFFCAYPKEGHACAVACGSGGAVDPKTHRKFVKAFTYAIADAESIKVSVSVAC